MKLLAAWQVTSNQIHNHIERENERNAFHDNVRFSNKSNRQAHIAPCSCSCSSSTVFIDFMFGAISIKRNWRTCPTQSSNGGKGSNRSVWNNWRAMHECDDQWSWFVDCCLRAYWSLPLFCLRMSACVCVLCARVRIFQTVYLISVDLSSSIILLGASVQLSATEICQAHAMENGMDNWITFAISLTCSQTRTEGETSKLFYCDRLDKLFPIPCERTINGYIG